MGGTGRPLGKTFFLQCQRRHPELPKIPTYLDCVHTHHYYEDAQRAGAAQDFNMAMCTRPNGLGWKAAYECMNQPYTTLAKEQGNNLLRLGAEDEDR